MWAMPPLSTTQLCNWDEAMQHRNHPMSIVENSMTSVFPWENQWIPVTFPRRVHATFDHDRRSSKRGRPRAAFNGHSAAGRRGACGASAEFDAAKTLALEVPRCRMMGVLSQPTG